ncbi:RHS repeat domain-containing protein [Crocinitomix catalasitica]|uniref:RHS repeat domain-containing protein n=1 Tax=Crocinitomix catalasitica TaxID=184607 RepID=UPI00048A0323|nr:RHS repeat-associated core domain-containing protein [Crocinitomix catalasitica]
MRNIAKIILTVLLLVINDAAIAGIEPVNVRAQEDDLYQLIDSELSLDIADNKYWMMIDEVWESEFSVASVSNSITFGIDESDMVYWGTSYAYRITIDVDYKELVGSEIHSNSVDGIVLEVNYDPANGTTYQDRSVYPFSNGLEVKIKVVSIEKLVGEVWVEIIRTSSPSSLPSCLFLESEIITERYYPFNQLEYPSEGTSIEVVDDELKIVWPFMEGAEDYDLEWTWVNRYKGTVDGSGDPELLLSSEVEYDFDLNATRVRISGQNTYNIPLVYGEGFILVRYRGVGRGGDDFKIPLEGRWNSDNASLYGSSGIVTDFGSNASNYFAITAHEGNEINYGAGMSFIEGGVRSVGVTYMDGVLKPRQSQAKLNSQDKIIVGSTIYDHYGRPAIGVMSAPVDQSTLGYVDNLNMFADGVPYGKEHFDVDVVDPEILCGEFLAAPPMNSFYSAGAANYYSADNPDKEGANAYLPDAEGYPFVQVQYADDPTGRIKRVGGLGPDHQLGDVTVDAEDRAPHYTEYYYTTPDGLEVYELFGNDAASSENYTKVITKDVHGQLSMAIVDPMGRTIATYMAGEAPNGLDQIKGNLGGDPEEYPTVTKDLSRYNVPDDIEGVIETNHTHFVEDERVTYDFKYEFEAANFAECLVPEVDLCFDCIYDMVITIKSDDPNCVIKNGEGEAISVGGMVNLSYTVGSIVEFDPSSCNETPLTFSGVNGIAASEFQIKFPKMGDYQIRKKLIVSRDPIDYYWDLYKENSTCLLSENFFINEALTYIDPTDCDDIDPCEYAFITENGTLATYLEENPSLDEEDYNAAREVYVADCEITNPCDYLEPLMEADFKEGGQYSIKDYILAHLDGDDEATALLNALFIDDDITDWRDYAPFLEIDGVTVSTMTNGAGEEVGPPYTGITLAQFADSWKDSWAKQFTHLHPEYCYFEFCGDNSGIYDYEYLLNSVDTYAEACSLGLLNPLPILSGDGDQIFEIGGCSADFDEALLSLPTDPVLLAAIKVILNESYVYADPLEYDIYEYAIYICGDDPSLVTFGTGCNKDKHWRAFRSLYFSKRFRIIELLKDQAVFVTGSGCSPYVDCIGKLNELPCEVVVDGMPYYPFQDKFPRYFDYESAFFDFEEFDFDAYDGVEVAEDAIDDACLSQCEGLADEWMRQLEGCEVLLDGEEETWATGQETYDLVKLKLIEVCAGGCDNEWPFPTQVDNGTVTDDSDPIKANRVYNSFKDVIIDLVGAETLECSHLLITNPRSTDGSESLITNLDDCACNLLLASASAEEFEDENGFLPIDYEAEKCQCDAFDNAGTNNDILEGAEIDALNAAEIFTPNTYPCDIHCIDCASLFDGGTALLSGFTTDFTALGEDDVTYVTHPELFVAYVNEINGSDFTYENLLELIANCNALENVSGTEVYHLLDPKTKEIRDLLNKLTTAGLASDQSDFNLYTLPEYLNASFYLCGDEDVATYDYTPSVTGSSLSFNISNSTCDGNCTLTATFTDGYPSGVGEFANATDAFNNILEFGEIYFLTAINLGELDRFYIDASIELPDGSIEIVQIRINMPCYDFITDHYTTRSGNPSFKICSGEAIYDEDDCLDLMIKEAELAGKENYEEYIAEKKAAFIRDYISSCTQVDEEFNVEYVANRYHYTLLYYDQSGNLVKTVSPKGVHKLDEDKIEELIDHLADPGSNPPVYPEHTFETTYKHNSLNQVVEVNTPDGGTSKYFYDHVGRLVVSQNAKQEDFQRGIITDAYDTGLAVEAYSYTRYDELGRVYEVGEISHPQTMTRERAKNIYLLPGWLDETIYSGTPIIKNNITLMHYDTEYSAAASLEFLAGGYGHTRNRIVATSVISGYVTPTAGEWIYPDPDYVNHYKYDVHGNVQSYLQEINALAQYSNRFRKVDYEYDLISGNPNYIYYQKGKPDQYIHKYVYDGDNRLKEVFTSSKGIIWDRDVNYEYREDGYLARTEIGEMKVQGMDYAYTLHGWLKTLNSGVLNAENDMGRDGRRDGPTEYSANEDEIHGLVAKDALAYTIGYYKNDYIAISDGETDFDNMQIELAGTFLTDATRQNLYNGNITSLITNLTDFEGDKLNVHANAYRYDQLHRFKDMHVYTHDNITSTNSLASAIRDDFETFTTDQFSGNLGNYEVHVDYDANGNITDLIRMNDYVVGDDHSDNGMDKFKYDYGDELTNKLTRVEDFNDSEVLLVGGIPVDFGDIKSDQVEDNYEYHDDGSLKSDKDEEIDYIDWYPSGKIKRIYRTGSSEQSDLYFEYDPMGMRTLKVEMTRTGTTLNTSNLWKYTYYASDANGTTMAIYELDKNDQDKTLQKTESMIYGGSRLGIDVENITVSGSEASKPCNNGGLGSFVFEIKGPSDELFWEAGSVIITFDGTTIADEALWRSPDIGAMAVITDINSSGLDIHASLISESIVGEYYYATIEVIETSVGAFPEGTITTYSSDPLVTITETQAFTAGDCYTQRELGLKYYELINHLGNVMEVVSDRKIAVEDDLTAGVIDYFEADVVQYSDYYPYGMTMPGRNGSISEKYRYAFNGMETDKEVSGSGNSYTTQFRQYDPRLGRWKSLDPLAWKYASKSPFISMSNNPTNRIDPNGDDDYFNSAGKFIGSDNKSTRKIYILTNADVANLKKSNGLIDRNVAHGAGGAILFNNISNGIIKVNAAQGIGDYYAKNNKITYDIGVTKNNNAVMHTNWSGGKKKIFLTYDEDLNFSDFLNDYGNLINVMVHESHHAKNHLYINRSGEKKILRTEWDSQKSAVRHLDTYWYQIHHDSWDDVTRGYKEHVINNMISYLGAIDDKVLLDVWRKKMQEFFDITISIAGGNTDMKGRWVYNEVKLLPKTKPIRINKSKSKSKNEKYLPKY